jgi:hypothetical protein
MKYLIFSFLFSYCFFNSINAQHTEIRNGAYKSFTDFRKNKPYKENVQFKFKPYWVNKNILKVKGGKLKSKDLKYDTWGIFQGSALYLNLLFLNKGTGYVKVLEFGRFSLYRIGRKEPKEPGFWESFFLEVFFPDEYDLLTSFAGKGERFYVFDLKNCLSKPINVPNMYVFLNNNRDLYQQYRNEEDNESIELIQRYLRDLNARLPIF